jgi:TonB family protein
VFIGRVINISPVASPSKIHFKIEKVYRGKLDAEVEVKSYADDNGRGYAFKQGESYLVYAQAPTKDYSSLMLEACSRTGPVAGAEEDIKYIEGLAKLDADVLEVEGGLRAISKPQPAYPKEARAAHVAGLVFVRLIIDETGKVVSAQSLCGPAALSEAAETAARNWQFAPTRINGKPVKASTVVTFNFAH